MRKTNQLLIIAVIILAVFHIILNFITDPSLYLNNKAIFLKDFSIVITIIAPYIVEKIFKYHIADGFKLVWIIFIFMAHYLGVILELYNTLLYYDKVVHTVSGILTAYVGMLILSHIKLKGNGFNILFIVSFSALCAVSWEIFEFVCNILVGGDAQKVIETGVDDTMLDMIVAIIGSIIYSIW